MEATFWRNLFSYCLLLNHWLLLFNTIGYYFYYSYYTTTTTFHNIALSYAHIGYSKWKPIFGATYLHGAVQGASRGFFRRADSFVYISQQGMTLLDLCLQLIPSGQGNQPRLRQPALAGLALPRHLQREAGGH